MPMPTQTRIRSALLRFILDRGGECSPNDAYEGLQSWFPELEPGDLEAQVSSGDTRWPNRIRFARADLVFIGAVDRSLRGVWKLTDLGRELAASENLDEELSARLRTYRESLGSDAAGADSQSTLGAHLSTFLAQWPTARTEPFAGHSAHLTMTELVVALQPYAENQQIEVRGSVGAGNWASVPWVAFLDQRATTTTQNGVYPVYLFRADGSGVYLALGQGATDLVNERGRLKARQELQARAETIGGPLRTSLPMFDFDEPLTLRGDTPLAVDYESAPICHRFYPADGIPDDDVLGEDLETLLEVYDAFVAEGDLPASPPVASAVPTLEDVAADTFLPLTQLAELEAMLLEQGQKQVVFEGPPGSGKTFVADRFARYLTEQPLEGPVNDQLVTVQFHQSYGYEDFVQGIRPQTDEDGHLRYEVRDGVFKALCERARVRPDERFVVLIDEINRGNISRILGELLLVLEYRDREIQLTYSSPGEPPFSVPGNVFVLGTMNTTDRSLAQIDYALRRRFYFYRLMPVVDGQAPVLRGWLEQAALSAANRDEVLELFLALNRRVTENLDEHFQVGHSYLMQSGIERPEVRERVWRHAVLPLLEEYFYNRPNLRDLLREFEPQSLLETEAESPS